MLYLMAPSIAWSRLTPLLGLGPRRVRCTAKRSGQPASHRDTEGHHIDPTASCRRVCPISRLTRPVGRQYKLHPARRRSSDQARPHALSIAPCKTTLWQQRLQTRKSLIAGGARAPRWPQQETSSACGSAHDRKPKLHSADRARRWQRPSSSRMAEPCPNAHQPAPAPAASATRVLAPSSATLAVIASAMRDFFSAADGTSRSAPSPWRP